MKAHEIYKQSDPAPIHEMFQWMRAQERNLYKTSLASLASVKKLRPVFLEKKSVNDQIEYMRKTLALRTQDLVGEHLFQVWFMKGQQDLLRTFCDRMSIEHDGDGQVIGDLPKELDQTKLQETVDRLLEMFDPKVVTIYLHVFNLQTANGWENLSQLLQEDTRLKLNDAA